MSLEINAGLDLGNLFTKAFTSTNGGARPTLISSDLAVGTTFNHAPYIDPTTQRLSSCVRLTNLRTNKSTGIQMVGDCANRHNRRRKSVIQAGGKKGSKLPNLPLILGSLVSVLVPRNTDEVTVNLACSVLELEHSAEVLRICGDTYRLEFAERVEDPDEGTKGVILRINIKKNWICPEGGSVAMATNDAVLRGVYFDLGHGTTGVTVREGTRKPSLREYEAFGVTQLFEALFPMEQTSKAGQAAGTGAATLEPLVRGVMDGSYKYGGAGSPRSFKGDYSNAIKPLLQRYDQMIGEFRDPMSPYAKLPLYAFGGGCNLPEVRKLIQSHGGTVLTDIIPEVSDPQLINAYYLHAALK